MIRVGIPRGLLYYYYGDIWLDFFRRLGIETVVSGETSPVTIARGQVVDEICLPVKVAIGHASELASSVDYIFLPRIVSLAAGQYTCPNIIGLPDLFANCVKHHPRLIDVTINVRRSIFDLHKAVIAIGDVLGCNAIKCLCAWKQACQNGSARKTPDCPKPTGRPRIALLGHPYILGDKTVSMDIFGKLQSMGFEAITADQVDEVSINQACRRLTKKIFWQYCQNLAGAGLNLIYSLRPLEGVIFLTSFGCGPDSMVAEIIKAHASKHEIPFLLLPVDEHTAQAGFVTRLEAFADMLEMRRNK